MTITGKMPGVITTNSKTTVRPRVGNTTVTTLAAVIPCTRIMPSTNRPKPWELREDCKYDYVSADRPQWIDLVDSWSGANWRRGSSLEMTVVAHGPFPKGLHANGSMSRRNKTRGMSEGGDEFDEFEDEASNWVEL